MQQNQEYIPHVLAVFLGESGMGHPDEVRMQLYDRIPSPVLCCCAVLCCTMLCFVVCCAVVLCCTVHYAVLLSVSLVFSASICLCL